MFYSYQGFKYHTPDSNIFLDGTKCKICLTHQWFIFPKIIMGQFFSRKKGQTGEGGGRGGFVKRADSEFFLFIGKWDYKNFSEKKLFLNFKFVEI